MGRIWPKPLGCEAGQRLAGLWPTGSATRPQHDSARHRRGWDSTPTPCAVLLRRCLMAGRHDGVGAVRRHGVRCREVQRREWGLTRLLESEAARTIYGSARGGDST
jgi:hypothetical protein